MKLIVGLGNPGNEYKKTRHNVGFMAVDTFSNLRELNFKSKFNGLYAETIINGEKTIILKPQTYMNLSGDAVLAFKNYFDVNIDDILVFYDDVNFEVGSLKIKSSGSSGGHNGINDIISKLKTNDIKRVKIGISKNTFKLKDYVLSEFKPEELDKLNDVFKITNSIIEEFSNVNFEKIMSKYNGIKNEK